MTYEEGEEFAKKHNLIFFETSAKTAFNVEKVDISAILQSVVVFVCDPVDLRKLRARRVRNAEGGKRSLC